MSEQIANQGSRAVELAFVPAPVPIEGDKAQRPSKYEGLVQDFWTSGHPSARVDVTWDTVAANKRAEIERAKNLAVQLRKVARRLELPVGATVRGDQVYLVRVEGTSDA